MELKNKLEFQYEVKALSADEGTFSAYGNVFNVVDAVGDVTLKGAFTNTIETAYSTKRMPKLLAQHGHQMMPVGIITDMKEDENGLYFEGKFALETQAGREYHALVKMGAIDQFSIGFKTLDFDLKGGKRYLKELDVKEISIVTFACNDDSRVIDVKEEQVSIELLKAGEEPTERLVQKSLQEAGLSKRQAESAITAIAGTKSAKVESPDYQLFLDSKSAVTSETIKQPTDFIEEKNLGSLSFDDVYYGVCDSLLKEFDSYDFYINEIFMKTGSAHLWSPAASAYKIFTFNWVVKNDKVVVSNLIEVAKVISYEPVDGDEDDDGKDKEGKKESDDPIEEKDLSPPIEAQLELKEDPMSWFNI